MAGCLFVECFAPQRLALSIGVIAVTERCSQPVAGSATQLSGQFERDSGDWWATLEPGQHQWSLQIVRREEWIAAAMARSA